MQYKKGSTYMVLFFLSNGKGSMGLLFSSNIVKCKCGPVVIPFKTPLDKYFGPTLPI